MDSITLLIKNEIKKRYGSVKKFSEASGIPYSTLTNALTKGVGGTAYDTVIKMCEILEIKQASDAGLVLFNKEFNEIYQMLVELDSQGRHTVETVLRVEYFRCNNPDSPPAVKAFNGIGLAHKPMKVKMNEKTK